MTSPEPAKFFNAQRIRLSDMERFQWLRHCPEYPNVFFCRLKFSGVLPRENWITAVEVVTRRHQLMAARVETRRGRMFWRLGGSATDCFFWHEKEFDPPRFRAAPIDLQKDPALRVDVFQGSTSTDVVCQVHHAATDGLGGLGAVSEAVKVLDNLSLGKSAESGLRPLDPDALQRRGRIGLFQKGFLKRLPFQWIAVFGVLKFALTRVAPLMPNLSRDRKPLPTNFPRFLTKELSRDLFQSLQETANDRRVSLNELLLAALFLAIDRWQRQQNITRNNKKIRIVVPISVRDGGDRRVAACNRMSLVQLDRSDKGLANVNGLIWGINFELGNIRRLKFEKVMLIVLRVLGLIPGLLRWRVTKPKCRATAGLSNVGAPLDRLRLGAEKQPLREGNHQWSLLEVSAPFYQQTPAVFLVSVFAGKYSISLNYDSRELDAMQASELLDSFNEQLNRLPSLTK